MLSWPSDIGGHSFAGYIVKMLEAATDGCEEATGGGRKEEMETNVVSGMEVREEVRERELGGACDG